MMQVQFERNLKTTGKKRGPWDGGFEIHRGKLPALGKSLGKSRREVEAGNRGVKKPALPACCLAAYRFKALSLKRRGENP